MVEYTVGTGEEMRKDFRDKKDSLEMDFPNLPYYIDGDLKISETLAIHKYIADKHNFNLLGRDSMHRA